MCRQLPENSVKQFNDTSKKKKKGQEEQRNFSKMIKKN